MPIHDWRRVPVGIFHHFHHEWLTSLSRGLNAGVLPAGYYALAEQIAGGLGPDVLTLGNVPQPSEFSTGNGTAANGGGGVAVATAPPKVRFTATSEMDSYARKRKSVVIRHASGHRVVAVIEI